MTPRVPYATGRISRRACDTDAEPGHDRRPRANSANWTCELRTLTPLCIHSMFNPRGRPVDERDPAIIPASSLRGMVRNVAEVLGAGCGRYQDWPPANLSPCTEADACVVCRVFGFVQGKFAWAGKVRFTDTAPASVSWVRLQIPLDRDPHEGGTGWLLFRHDPVRLREDRSGPRCVPAGQVFRFQVGATNLDPEEMAVFRFALTLSHGEIDLCHKLGFAKAAGLGSCKISIIDTPQRPLPPLGTEIDPYLRPAVLDVLQDARSYR